MDSPILVLAFVSLFHLLGGGALGVALRDLRTRSVNWNLAIWGALFGGLPLLLGLAIPPLLVWQLLVLALAFGVTFLYWERVRELLVKPSVLLMILGGALFAIGAATAGLQLREGQGLAAIRSGAGFGGVGIGLIALGFLVLLRPPSDEGEA